MPRRTDFEALKIRIASPEDILSWSHGEVTKPETINYRTQRPEKDGLFSERIFGPTKDWECYCGKYRKIRYKGVVCDKCGVEVTRSIVRRQRMGHIELATPVAHTWFLKNVPSVMSLVLDEPLKKLERVVYYAAYIVTAVDEEKRKAALADVEKEYKARQNEQDKKKSELETAAMGARDFLNDLRPGRILSEAEFIDFGKRFGNAFTVMSGGEGVRKVLESIDLAKAVKDVEKELKSSRDAARRKKLLRRLKLMKSMITNGIRPEWTVLTVLPILPPDLRPMVALDGGRYATSDLNDLYRRVINRNNRLKKLLELKAPDVIVINEKRMLQEAIDVLIDNSRSKQTARGRRPLRSLSDMLKGKQGRFRQNLLGKRVDYSGRSVIVVGPNLRLDECGIPKRMALELFRPFVIHKIIEHGLAYNIRNSNRLIDQAPPEVWEILEDVIADKKVLLNRAPTLHRLSIQAFKPILVEGLAIQIPPMVCAAFNADFDGDQMAVHLPLSDEAQFEAGGLMLSKNNLLKPASGEAITVPTQDIVLGCHYVTRMVEESGTPEKHFSSGAEAKLAYNNDYIKLSTPVYVGKMRTTCGRVIFNEALPEEHAFLNETVTKKSLTSLVGKLINIYGAETARDTLDKIKDVGFEYATVSGISLGASDIIVPKLKKEILEEASAKVDLIGKQYQDGFLTNAERRERSIEVWSEAKSKVDQRVPESLGESNPISVIIQSGARGSWNQPNQMAGMRGIVANPKGESIELPIRTSLKEGHTSLEYFISTHGSRKGLVDTALRTAEAGYLTRRLIDAAQDMVIKEDNCKTTTGITVYKEDEIAEYSYGFTDRLFSRVPLNDIKIGKKIVAKAGEIITAEAAAEIALDKSIESIEVRSPITCKTLYGLCSKCYGLDLGTNEDVKIGEAVGIVAAQSIGELGTQLTLRTFHGGGLAGRDITTGLPRVDELFERRIPKQKGLLSEIEGTVEDISEDGALQIVKIKKKGATAKKDKLVEHSVLRSKEILVKVGDKVMPGDQLTSGSLDPQELFALKGKADTARYLIREIQRIYRSEGALVHDKHMEVIVRQMFSRVEIVDPGDTDFIVGDIVDKSRYKEVNSFVKDAGKERAKGRELILGITKAVLSGDGFLAAASFQETARVLIKASSEGRIDNLRGLKENVIIGRLVPIGAAFRGEIDVPEDEGMDERVEN
ncbi:MAG: DNA-directed RNA polymerase subunit beta' [Candidatus Colwellbacteria bacterium RIFCSPHIGHO2_02_FULL_45_17]|uniref:DNA-directed RNA polymerase subunit beta' n=1 Tax=Candidatus Colwellbacteria bacterium RIFCSPLOWO2_12_FULL_46_17 TaxID=1797695 RepID=A0A1G1ZDK4_9BACT|nr:MAG: DNA-directed RNA polymerase subunit beta' [Candidatus Colwellbacteria bacterium RIFCSPHIGHO2_02_FULL_45_17]OGY62691.1 MAG: DNA-directed RNA polymerase subunit beta' [Candidatus Colwellbacteria bacterium RIFCSPLOWO2_12_FULL_46_17]